MLTRVGVYAGFEHGVFTLKALIGFVSINLFPQKPKKTKTVAIEEKPDIVREPVESVAAEGKELAPAEPEKPGFIQSLDKGKLVALGFKALARFSRILRIDVLELRVVAASEAPDKAAALYGKICAALGAGLPFLHRMFRVKRQSIVTDINFKLAKPDFSGKIKLTVRVGSVLLLGIWLLFKLADCRKRKD